ncbi:TPA: site-specific integrase [Salmonella enterica]|uniref:Site-specific integrase n=1 Tax=Salmonella enterica TaxID=28901 RepID=A0A759RNW3_SALER|nr:site-specific integrase [Salmonella enterica]
MSVEYGLKCFTLNSGERYCQVIDKTSGVPLYYPNLYITLECRNKGASISTIELVAGSLLSFERYLFYAKIDIRNRITDFSFLSNAELDALYNYISKRHKRLKVVNIRRLPEVADRTRHFRITTIINYLKWYISEIIPFMSDEQIHKTGLFIKRIESRKPRIKQSYYSDVESKALDEKQQKELRKIIDIGSLKNPFKPEVQLRNYLLIHILLELGIRCGEILNIQIKDINFDNSILSIIRRPDEIKDPRKKQPLVKTNERTLPLSPHLVSKIKEYIFDHRKQTPWVSSNAYLFITHKKGATLGHPLSISAYHKIIDKIRSSSLLLNKFTGHTLRHTWNYNFSVMAINKQRNIKSHNAEKYRSYLMGWEQNSGTAQTYNKKFIESESHKLMMEMSEAFFYGLGENKDGR